MGPLAYTPLLTLTLEVDFANIVSVGQTPRGHRQIAPVTGGRFEGARLNGKVYPGADWVINRPDGVMLIDVRLTLESDDSALIYLSYEGRMLFHGEALHRFRNGKALSDDDYSLVTRMKFETGDERYRDLNDAVAVATGTQTPTGVIYEVFEIG